MNCDILSIVIANLVQGLSWKTASNRINICNIIMLLLVARWHHRINLLTSM